MNASPHPTNSSTPAFAASQGAPAKDAVDEEDLALGWECANPALQIELWGAEAAAQPLPRAC